MASILIVDDDPVTRQLLNRILAKEGFTIFEASNGKEALERSDEQAVDLVITDIVMPEKEGIEMILELKGKKNKARIIAITGGGRFGSGNYLDLAMQLGACAALEKPIDRGKLLAAVHEALAVP